MGFVQNNEDEALVAFYFFAFTICYRGRGGKLGIRDLAARGGAG